MHHRKGLLNETEVNYFTTPNATKVMHSNHKERNRIKTNLEKHFFSSQKQNKKYEDEKWKVYVL